MPLEDIFIYLGNLQLKHIELQQCYYICRDPKFNMVSKPNCKCKIESREKGINIHPL